MKERKRGEKIVGNAGVVTVSSSPKELSYPERAFITNPCKSRNIFIPSSSPFSRLLGTYFRNKLCTRVSLYTLVFTVMVSPLSFSLYFTRSRSITVRSFIPAFRPLFAHPRRLRSTSNFPLSSFIIATNAITYCYKNYIYFPRVSCSRQ